MAAAPSAWPELPFAQQRPTMETLHLMLQVVGKVRLARTPWLNHSWHVTLYVSARGLTTGLIPHDGLGLELEFDFVDSALVLRTTQGGERRVALAPTTIAAFYAAVMQALNDLSASVAIDAAPNEMPDATPFAQDTAPRAYDPEAATRFWRAMVQLERVFTRFRSAFLGKCSPVHLFWGSLDLAVTRFSGRRAPPHPGGIPHLPDAVTREAYSHEVSSAGFWPGGGGVDEACFYSYAYPTPEGFAEALVAPAAARFEPKLGEFVLPYDAVRAADDPDATLLAFLESTYAAAADLAGWDREALECAEGRPAVPRLV